MPQTWTSSPWVKANREEAHLDPDHMCVIICQSDLSAPANQEEAHQVLRQGTRPGEGPTGRG